MERYFYAKIGDGNYLAEDYLAGNNELGAPAIPIYFDGTPANQAAFLSGGSAKEQGRLFFECGASPSHKNVVVIHNGKVTIASPSGNVIFKTSTKHKNHLGNVKLLPVTIQSRPLSITEVPAILASMTANRYYYSGTFREIKDMGNLNALQYVTNRPISIPATPSLVHVLECLSSFELETLVAKLLEEAGCFVPAYRGGNMKGADLFAYNDTNSVINIAGLAIPHSRKGVSIQVKRSNKKLSNPPAGVDYLVGLKVKPGTNNFDQTWFLNSLNTFSGTKSWLKRSLNWLPQTYLATNGLP
ncbi:hypothetical protein CR161_06180 [Prosthecochloris sp. ZM]|uniref:hypothetical protein n=1 Tax=Prosthecochloris sp. ZM TaxID=2283143 RepID=UPI000DF84CA8|nr:hypothetical protein [Prosthecochloris sp. ZM]RDD30331.1 hypothetical protein CR161_06180 [Prosthecochloris sp. ZM]